MGQKQKNRRIVDSEAVTVRGPNAIVTIHGLYIRRVYPNAITGHAHTGCKEQMASEMKLEDSGQYVCTTKAKQCAGQDPCYFDDERKRCGSGFRIKVKKVGGV